MSEDRGAPSGVSGISFLPKDSCSVAEVESFLKIFLKASEEEAAVIPEGAFLAAFLSRRLYIELAEIRASHSAMRSCA